MEQDPNPRETNNQVIPLPSSGFTLPALASPDDCLAFAQKINPRKEPLTVGILRKLPGCEHYSDPEAEEIVQAIEQLTVIIFKTASENTPICIDNQLVVNLDPEAQLVTIPINANKTNNLAA